ncbi:hypothetical protein FP388_04310 [Citrobacter europaeus]|nr:hypothetical protein [Citrobacter europaeus]
MGHGWDKKLAQNNSKPREVVIRLALTLRSSSLSRSSPSLQGNFNQCETEWCNHHFFSVTIILPGEGLRMSVFHLCTRLCANLAIVG